MVRTDAHQLRPVAGDSALVEGIKVTAWAHQNRIQLEVADLEHEVAALRAAGAHLRGEIVTGRGGSQVLLDDPAGNPIELFQPAGT